ncbi:hypothetical protein D3093_33650 (plasmid) [Azospirillum argentinense]|uniref:Uncharacterized protein n=1 Tax=Azospirillum argentinense TaxID=2970906 RepID=A0A4D8Q1E8_9PROT|nr:hypothetical protein D3093_33650 [Azospirillum argentinense]
MMKNSGYGGKGDDADKMILIIIIIFCRTAPASWALREGRSYGTILVDLKARRVVDLLPDRTAQTLTDWLIDRDTVTVIARDRSTEYARGMIPVAGRQHHPGLPHPAGIDHIRPSRFLAAGIPPGVLLRIEPAAVREHPRFVPMGAPALPAPSRTMGAGDLEADVLGDQRPVDRVQPAGFTADRHPGNVARREPLSISAIGGKRNRCQLINTAIINQRQLWPSGC